VTSLYVDVDPGPGGRTELRARVSSLLDQARALGRDTSLDRESRLSVRADIERIRQAQGEQRWRPRAVATRCRETAREQIVVDAAPYVRPLLAVLSEYHRSCAVVIDKAWAKICEIYQDEMQEVSEVRGEKLRKPNFAAGLGEDHVRSRDEELAKRHYRQVAEMLDEMLRAGRYDLLVIGGHDYEVPAFTEQLSHEVAGRLAGAFTMDPATATAAEIRSSSAAILDRYEREAARQLADDVLARAAAARQAVAGLAECLWAGSVAAVRSVVLAEGAEVPGVVCERSDWLALSGAACRCARGAPGTLRM